jgi:uncharacterized GH25 family protein
MFVATFPLRAAQCKRIQRLLGVLCFTCATSSWGHDFWIEPLKFQASSGTAVTLKLLVGQEFKGDSALYLPEQFERYVVVASNAEQPVVGNRGDDPAGRIVIGDGMNVVGYHSRKFEVSFDSLQEFESYLQQEGLERQATRARERSGGRILEIYSRHAKALVAGPNARDAADCMLGFPLEIVAETNPYHQKDLRLRLLYLGRPLEGTLVTAFSKADPARKLRLRTDAEGRVRFTVPRPGVWLVTAVHMMPKRWYERADWESFWASLTFEAPKTVPVRPAPAAPARACAAQR